MSALSIEGRPTQAEMTTDDFVVHGRGEGTFRYPFDSKHGGTQVAARERPEFGSPFGLELSGQTDEWMFVAPGFNLQEAVMASRGAIIEVAGPTPGGYHSLVDVDLPRKPIITNIASGVQPASEGLSVLDKLTLDTMASARALPFKDESVGVLMTASLTKIDMENYGHLEAKDMLGKVSDAYASAIKKVEHGGDVAASSQDESDISPRIGLWHEAERLVEPSGLFIMRGVTEDDIKLGTAMGFEVIAHTPPWTDNDEEIRVPYECVFRRISSENEKTQAERAVRRGFGHSALTKLEPRR